MIRLRNPYPVRTAVALSVEGLNTIDARHTDAAHARKWVIEPYGTLTISGWQTSRTDARRFEFTTEAQSYGQALGRTVNLGVISAVFFKERVSTVVRDRSHDTSTRRAPAAPSADPTADLSTADAASMQSTAKAMHSTAEEKYAATKMGRRTDHAIKGVWLDLEGAPMQTVNIRYEYRPQLVRLGILPEPTQPIPYSGENVLAGSSRASVPGRGTDFLCLTAETRRRRAHLRRESDSRQSVVDSRQLVISVSSR